MEIIKLLVFLSVLLLSVAIVFHVILGVWFFLQYIYEQIIHKIRGR